MITKVEEVRGACAVLAQHAALVAENGNAAATLMGLAERYQRAAAACGPAQETAPLDAENIYSRRRGAIAAAQRRPA